MYKALLTASAIILFASPLAAEAKAERIDLTLDCAPKFQTVSWGDTAAFAAMGNVNGPFEWVTPDFGVVDAGSVFAVPMTWSGHQQIDVVWGSQRATCYVDVVGGPASYEQGYDYIDHSYDYGPNVTLSSVLYPYLPHAGFGPANFAAFAFAAVLLMGFALALYPHVRYAFVIVTR